MPKKITTKFVPYREIVRNKYKEKINKLERYQYLFIISLIVLIIIKIKYKLQLSTLDFVLITLIINYYLFRFIVKKIPKLDMRKNFSASFILINTSYSWFLVGNILLKINYNYNNDNLILFFPVLFILFILFNSVLWKRKKEKNKNKLKEYRKSKNIIIHTHTKLIIVNLILGMVLYSVSKEARDVILNILVLAFSLAFLFESTRYTFKNIYRSK